MRICLSPAPGFQSGHGYVALTSASGTCPEVEGLWSGTDRLSLNPDPAPGSATTDQFFRVMFVYTEASQTLQATMFANVAAYFPYMDGNRYCNTIGRRIDIWIDDGLVSQPFPYVCGSGSGEFSYTHSFLEDEESSGGGLLTATVDVSFKIEGDTMEITFRLSEETRSKFRIDEDCEVVPNPIVLTRLSSCD